jgi:hypothetical protein
MLKMDLFMIFMVKILILVIGSKEINKLKGKDHCKEELLKLKKKKKKWVLANNLVE